MKQVLSNRYGSSKSKIWAVMMKPLIKHIIGWTWRMKWHDEGKDSLSGATCWKLVKVPDLWRGQVLSPGGDAEHASDVVDRSGMGESPRRLFHLRELSSHSLVLWWAGETVSVYQLLRTSNRHTFPDTSYCEVIARHPSTPVSSPIRQWTGWWDRLSSYQTYIWCEEFSYPQLRSDRGAIATSRLSLPLSPNSLHNSP